MPSKKPFRSKKLWWLQMREKIGFLIFLAIFCLVSPSKGNQTVAQSMPEIPMMRRETPMPLPDPHPYPMNISGTQPPDVTAYSVLVLDADSSVVMYAKNEKEPLPPASTTKILTALVALDLYKPTDVVTVQASSASGQLMDLEVGEKMTVENLLYGMLILSGNDAAYALAMHHPQGYDAFIQAMNDKAKELNLQESSFTNPAGYDDLLHKMSARDLGRVGRFAMQDPLIAKIVALPQITISDVDHTIYHSLKNVNQLLGKIPGMAGIKTGWTEEAGENLVSLVQRNGHSVIFVTLKSKDRFGDTTKLVDWAFKNYQWVKYGI